MMCLESLTIEGAIETVGGATVRVENLAARVGGAIVRVEGCVLP